MKKVLTWLAVIAGLVGCLALSIYGSQPAPGGCKTSPPLVREWQGNLVGSRVDYECTLWFGPQGPPNWALNLAIPPPTPTPTNTATPTMVPVVATAAMQATLSLLISPTPQAAVQTAVMSVTLAAVANTQPSGLVIAPEIRPKVVPVYFSFTGAVLDLVGAGLIIVAIIVFFYLVWGKGGGTSVGKMSTSLTKTMDKVHDTSEYAWGITLIIIFVVVGLILIFGLPGNSASSTSVPTAPQASPTAIRIEIIVPTPVPASVTATLAPVQPTRTPTRTPTRKP